MWNSLNIFYTIKIDCNVSKQLLILKIFVSLPIIEHLSTNKNYVVSHQCDPSLNYSRTDYEIRKNITAHSRPCNARCTSTLHRWPLPCEEAGNGKYFPEEMHTRAWRITLDRCQSSTLTFVYLFQGGSCRPTRIPRISESVVFSSCRANTPLPVNYNYRRRWTSLDRGVGRRLIFEMSSGEGRVRNSGKWAVFSISFWSRELRFPSISLRFRITRMWRGLFFEIFVIIRGE